MEVEGMIIKDLGAFEGVSKSGNPWKKHEYVMETMGQYPRKIKFTVFGEKSSTLVFELGKTYLVQFDIDSREFNERWYTDIMVFNGRLVEPGQSAAPGFPQPGGSPAPAPQNPYASVQSAPETRNPFGQTPGAPDFTTNDSPEDLPF